MSKQTKAIIILASVAVLLAAAYFGIVSPIVNKEEPAVTTEPEVTAPGEVVGANDRIQLFEQVTRADIDSIFVHNEYGDYTFYRSGSSFYIKGFEGSQYDSTLFSSLVVDCGYTLSLLRVAEEGESVDFAEYGLSDADDPAYYILTTLEGVSHKVYVGNMIPSRNGYYVKYEGRAAVYILDDSIADTVLAPVENMVTATLTYPTSLTTYYMIRNFTLFRGHEMFVSFKYLEESERPDSAAYSAHAMLYPGDYYVSGNLDSTLQLFMEFTGDSTVKLGLTEQSMAQYGLDDPAYSLVVINSVTDDDGTVTGFVPNILYFSEKQEDGTYYVASTLYNIIASVNATKLSFLEWDLKMWVTDYIYATQIDLVSQMTFESQAVNVTYTLSGTGTDLTVKASDGFTPETKNFRQLYKTLIGVNQLGVAALSDSEKEALVSRDGSCMLTLSVLHRDGRVREYRFYPYSAMYAYYTVNGDGEFYVLRSSLEKVISDVQRLQNGETINADDKY